jgi:hypothetical protein
MMGIKQHKIMNICLAQLSIFYFTDDDFRPFLMSYGKSSNDYINAVIIPVSTLMMLLYPWIH